MRVDVNADVEVELSDIFAHISTSEIHDLLSDITDNFNPKDIMIGLSDFISNDGMVAVVNYFIKGLPVDAKTIFKNSLSFDGNPALPILDEVVKLLTNIRTLETTGRYLLDSSNKIRS